MGLAPVKKVCWEMLMLRTPHLEAARQPRTKIPRGYRRISIKDVGPQNHIQMVLKPDHSYVMMYLDLLGLLT